MSPAVRTAAMRVMALLPTLLVASVVVFAAINLVPGRAATAALGLNPEPSAIAAFNARYGLDKPLPVQYLSWIGGILRGDFGRSFQSDIPIGPEVANRIAVTLELAVLAMLVSVLLGMPAGMAAGWFHRGRLDAVLSWLGTLGMSMPPFWLATVLVLIVALRARLLPPGGYVALWDDPGKNLALMIMPALSLGLVSSTLLFRIIRASTIEVLSTEYVLAARARGSAVVGLLLRHVLPNSAIPALTVLGLQVGTLFGGAVVIEQIFILPGMGSYVLAGIENRDYGILQASVLVITALVLSINALVDVASLMIDPRKSQGSR